MTDAERIIELFNEALAKSSAEERERFLAAACAGDPELKREISALLGAGERAAGNFLRQSLSGEAKPALPAEQPGDRIGRYTLRERLGEGGCGVVYLAEQTEPVRRQVALKVIKLGMDTQAVIARFEAERQALALMDHPNIARVLDAGATETGRPFFVMELVRGIRITDYCEQNNLSTRERLGLFIQACQAIQHAHQKGIIHRDIKPSNVLVARHDTVAVPKVIDFGIAKATTDQRLTDKTVFTAFEQFLGTPAYMSPEQAQLSGLDVDTRSDIYSLGVLLYELLTGRTPFDQKELLAAGLDEMRRIIREVEPVKPSTRLTKEVVAAPRQSAADSGTGDGGALPRRRYGEIQELITALRGDLDWIVMKTLEKDRARRYETANGLARDIERHLNNEPVVARPPSQLYRFQKMVRRNKLVFAAAGAVAATLLIGLGGSTWLFFKEKQARQQADAAAARSDQATRYLQGMVDGYEPTVAYGRGTPLSVILDRAAARKAGGSGTNQQSAETDLRSLLGKTYLQLESVANAKTEQEGETARRMLGPDHTNTLRLLLELMAVQMARQDFAIAEQTGTNLLRFQQAVFGPDHWDTLTTMCNLGEIWREQGRYDEAEPMFLKELEFENQLPPARRMRPGITMNNLALLYAGQGRYVESERWMTNALATLQREEGDLRPTTLNIMFNLAHLYLEMGRAEEGTSLLAQTLAWRRRVLGPKHAVTLETLRSLAEVHNKHRRYAEAEPLQQELVRLTREHLPDERGELASNLAGLAVILIRLERYPEAERAARDCLAIRTNASPDHWLTFNTQAMLGTSLLGQSNYADAERELRAGYQGMKLREIQIPPAGKVRLKESLQRLVQLYEETDRPAQAAEWKQKLAEFDQAEAIRQPAAPAAK
jgi:serine/threonine protein kinase